MILFFTVLMTEPAAAAEFSLGATQTYNDPFLKQLAAMVGTAQSIAPGVRAGVNASLFLDRGESDWKNLTEQLVNENHVSPDISKRAWDVSFLLAVEPFRGRVGGISTGLGMYGGLGLVGTVDDLAALQAEGDPRAESTESQIHPSQVWGTFSDVMLSETFSVRFRWHHVSYIETVNATTLESKGNAQFALEAVWTPDARSGMGKPTMAGGGLR